MVEDRPSTDLSMGVSEVFLVSSLGFGIIDSGRGETFIGQDTLNSLFRMSQKQYSRFQAFDEISMCSVLATNMKGCQHVP